MGMLLIVCRRIYVISRIITPMYEKPREMVGKRIKELRTKLGMSQEELADVCGLHRTYIGSVERGERNLSLQNIIRIARALGITPSILLKDIK